MVQIGALNVLPSMLQFFMSIFLENMHTLAFFFSVLCTLPFASFAEANKNLSGFSIDLIHRDSPLSPFYNSSMTKLELIKNAALRSDSRMNRVINSLSFSSSSSSLNENESPNESILIPNSGDYLMKIYIGTPPVERLVIFDTGSDLNWVQCSPCLHCFPQDTPIYEPSKSSTLTNVSCDSQSCALLNQHQDYCGSTIDECIYAYSYGDKSYTVGILVTDSINFGNSTSGVVSFPKFIFGCGNFNNFTADISGRPTGLVGLGAGPLSLVSQLGDSIGKKFSYCLLPPDSTFNSKLKFGDKATILGNGVVSSTPLIIKSPFYYLNLEGVTVGTKTMKTGGQTTNGNIIIDSGTTLTYLEPSFYDDFLTSVKEAIVGVEALQDEDVPHPLRFCFKHDQLPADMNFPNTVFHFTGANITLKPENLYLLLEDLLCLAVAPAAANFNGVSIFGNLAQIDFQVEYDLDGGKVSFAPTNCTNN